jgi:transposase-like protein
MNNKLNIEELKYLIPDYITGALDENEKLLVDNALKESAELREFYNEAKNTLEFVSNVKFEEPPAQYWNNLLPRIHEKIDARAAKKFSWDNISAIWKIIVPVAAVILFFIIYQLVKSPENQITKKQENKEQKVITDSSSNVKNEVKEEKKEQVEKKDDNAANNIKGNDSKVIKEPKFGKRNSNLKHQNVPEDNLAQKNKDNNSEDLNNDRDNNIANEEFALIETEENSILPGHVLGAMDDETESELNNLNGNEKDQLIENLLKTDL